VRKQLQEKKFFGNPEDGGLNSDDAIFSVGVNQWVNSENIRIGSTDAGYINTVESVGSTLLLSTPQPSVTFITIGNVADTANNRIFYFQKNIYTPDDRIICWDENSNTFYTVLLSIQVTGGLNFSKYHPIHSAKIVGDLLYWTDGYTDPKRINVEAAIKMNQPGYVTSVTPYTNPLNQSVITLIRRPPGRQLALTFSTDTNRENFVKNFAGEFAISYVYRDGEESVVGMPSQFVNYRYDFGTFSGASSDTTNVITLALSAPAVDGEYIDQDVQKVQYLVRFNNQPQYFIIKEWDKANTADAAEISAYNAGGSLSYAFYNDKVGVPISVTRSIKPADSVPNLSETLELGLQRLFLGNNTIGYDTPTETSLTATATPGVVTGVATKIFVPYTTYQVGIRFRDYYKRQCGVLTTTDLLVEIPDRGDYNDNSLFVENIVWALSNSNAINEIPDWAYYYDIVITKNLKTRNFVEWIPNSLKYAIKNADGTFTYQDTYSVNVYGIAFGTAFLSQQGMGILYQQGDFLRVYANGLSPVPFSIAAVAQDEEYIICTPINLGNLTSFSTPILARYYTPYIQSEEEPFYTCGIGYRVSAPATAGRQYSTLTGNIQGDVFFTSRVQIFIPTYYSVSQSPSDSLWQFYWGFYGEANIVTRLGRVVKETSVKWSNTIIEGSQINGLSTFDPLDEKLLPIQMGELKKLQQTSKVEAQGNVMLAISEDETASLYLGEVQAYGADQRATQVYAVDNVIGTVNILRGNYGTQNPESVIEYRGQVYWVDVTNGRVIRYDVNGLFAISDYKMTTFWKQFCTQFASMTAVEIEDLGGRPFIFTVIDPRHNELIISIPKTLTNPPYGYLPDYPSAIFPFNIWDGQAKSIVYYLDYQRWGGAYSFVGENYVALNNNLYSWKYGQLYQHNQTNSFNEFYGTVYKSKIMFVSNQSPNRVKVYNNISIEEGVGVLRPSLTYFYSVSPNQQSSDLVDFSWTNLEGNLYSPILRNKLVPTNSGFTTDGLLTGEKIRTYALQVLVEWDITNTSLELRFITLGFDDSIGQTT